MAVTDERKRLFLDTLAKTGSWKAASAAASGHLIRDGHPGSRLGVGTFENLAKRDPVFAEQVQAAMNVALANVENVVYDRIHMPNRRPIYDKVGNLLGYEENWRDANVMALRFLERHDGGWVQRKQIDGTQHVVHSNGDAPGGMSYHITSNDVMALTPERRTVLTELLDEVEANRDFERDAPALPLLASAPEGVADGPE